MRLLLAASLIVAIVMGCATTSKDILPPEQDLLPPAFEVQTPQDRQSLDYFLLKMADSAKKTNVSWWSNYRRAVLWTEMDPGVACEKFTNLALDAKFPARRIALVRAVGVCGSERPETKQLPALDLATVEPWLKGLALEVSLTKAKRLGDKSALADLLIEKSKRSVVSEEKIDFIQQAIQLATETEDKSLLEQAQERLGKVAPRFLSRPNANEWFSVANDFRRARQFDQSRMYYEKIIASPRFSFTQRVSAMRGLSVAYKNERQKDEYIKTLARIWQFTEGPIKSKAKGKRKAKSNTSTLALKTYHDAGTNYARALWTAGRPDEARKILQATESRLATRFSLDEIFWLYGRMEEEKANLSLAVEWFKKANSEKHLDTELAEKIRWYLGWNYRKLKSWPEAVSTFRQARDQAGNDFSRSRFQYWLARSLVNAGQSDDARGEFASLESADPLGYYGLLAHRESKTPITRPGLAGVKGPPHPTRIKELIDPVLIEWLVALDEADVAREILDGAAESLRRQDPRGDDQATWLDLFRFYARSGSYLQLYERLGRLETERRNRLLDEHPELVFPQPYREYVQASASQFNIPAELIFSIMRQESAFNPRARSAADAFGLMQLLPEVAKQASATVKVGYERAEDLYLPHVNIPIGAYHMRQLWDRFNGQFILAVASYNASQDVIRAWMRTRYSGDAVDFIEEIPYEETRGYVRLVMRNLIFYKVMNASGPIEFPEWVLDLKPPGET